MWHLISLVLLRLGQLKPISQIHLTMTISTNSPKEEAPLPPHAPPEIVVLRMGYCPICHDCLPPKICPMEISNLMPPFTIVNPRLCAEPPANLVPSRSPSSQARSYPSSSVAATSRGHPCLPALSSMPVKPGRSTNNHVLTLTRLAGWTVGPHVCDRALSWEQIWRVGKRSGRHFSLFKYSRK